MKLTRTKNASQIESFITIVCFAILIFFAVPDLVRWIYGLAP